MLCIVHVCASRRHVKIWPIHNLVFLYSRFPLLGFLTLASLAFVVNEYFISLIAIKDLVAVPLDGSAFELSVEYL